MNDEKSLNKKMVTKCTIRFHDEEFVDELNSLYKKVGGSQSSFFNMLIKEGYKMIAPLYEKEKETVVESFIGVLGERIESSLKEMRDIVIEKSSVELKGISSLEDEMMKLLRFLSCLYNLLLYIGIDDKEIKEIVEEGGFDNIPKRFA